MKTIGLLLTACFALPALLHAEEPAGGTLIEMSSVGGFILITSLLMLFGSRKPDSKLARLASKFFPGKR